MTGLDDFKQLLKEYRGLSLWAAGGSVIFPFVASFVAIIALWPAGLNVITSVFQLLALIFVYQRYNSSSKAIITRNVTILFLGVLLANSILYSIVFDVYDLRSDG
jgi:hypothetical protein